MKISYPIWVSGFLFYIRILMIHVNDQKNKNNIVCQIWEKIMDDALKTFDYDLLHFISKNSAKYMP